MDSGRELRGRRWEFDTILRGYLEVKAGSRIFVQADLWYSQQGTVSNGFE